MQIQTNGKTYDFTIKSIRRGSWVVIVDRVDGAYDGFWWGELYSKRQAQQSAKAYAQRVGG